MINNFIVRDALRKLAILEWAEKLATQQANELTKLVVAMTDEEAHTYVTQADEMKERDYELRTDA